MIPKAKKFLLLMGLFSLVFLIFSFLGSVSNADTLGELGDAIDISHHTGDIAVSDVRCWIQSGVKHIIVRAGIREEVSGDNSYHTRDRSKQQLKTLWQAKYQEGLEFSVDIFLYVHWPPNVGIVTPVPDQVREAIELLGELDIEYPLPVHRLWIDLEEAPPGGQSPADTVSLIREALDACDSFPCGIYTRKGWWTDYTEDTENPNNPEGATEFSNYPLWYADYDCPVNKTLSNSELFGGWTLGNWATPVLGKQYDKSDGGCLGDLCSKGVDYDIMYLGPFDCLGTVSSGNWRGEYFSNKDLDGPHLMVRDDGDGFLDFDWAKGGPGTICGVNANSFSARWTRDVHFEGGTYRFTVTSDDGVRLYIDGQKELDEWRMQGSTTFDVDVVLSEGYHKVIMEYFENGGDAIVQLSWKRLSHPGCIQGVSPRNWKGEYFDNMDLNGSPLMVRYDGSEFLNFDWANGSPDTSCGIGADNFSVRWTRSVHFEGGTYRFTVTSDDGVRLYIDGKKELDKWGIQSATTYTVDVPLSGGDHDIKLEYYEDGGDAVAKLSWKQVSHPGCIKTVSPQNWKGEYFGNKDLDGPHLMVRDDGNVFLNFDWANGSPDTSCGLGADYFSVRWTRTVNFEGGTYRFTVTSDDGVRLYIDGALKLQKWFDQGSTTYRVDVPLSGGDHVVKLEYYENGGDAVAKLSWNKILQGRPDLKVSSITFSTPPKAGVRTTAFAWLSNVGQTASGGFNVKWFLNGVQVGYGYHIPLAPGQVSTDNVRFYWTPTRGVHTLRFEADVDKQVVESNENNNKYQKTVTVTE
jgi:hypothetical protein